VFDLRLQHQRVVAVPLQVQDRGAERRVVPVHFASLSLAESAAACCDRLTDRPPVADRPVEVVGKLLSVLVNDGVLHGNHRGDLAVHQPLCRAEYPLP
jgi:hypothetical protein